MRRAALLALGAARRAACAQPPPSFFPAAQLPWRTLSVGAEEASEWAARSVKARGSSKSKSWGGKGKAAKGDAAPAAAGARQQEEAARAAEPPPPRLVSIPDRVTVRQLAKALEVTTARVEAIMADLDEAPASEEEYDMPRSPSARSHPSQAGRRRHRRAGCAGSWWRGAGSLRGETPAALGGGCGGGGRRTDPGGASARGGGGAGPR